ncbi:MAG: NAD(P)H-dependent oxidoreductase subunit E [Rubricoccaceae bacterium]
MTPETPGPTLRDGQPRPGGVSPKPAYLPGEPPPRTFSDEQLVWTDEERTLIDGYRAQYPTPDGAVMKTLWLAQRKFAWLAPEVMQLVADTLGLPYAKVYGVATFYTQYYKEPMGQYVFDVCTGFSCQACGAYDILHYLEESLGITKGQTTPDGLFTILEAECLGACGSAPMLQITNGPYVHNLTREKTDRLLADLREGRMPGFESVTLPQDEEDLGGNRRSDADAVERYVTPPVAQALH